MEKHKARFLTAYRAALTGGSVDWDQPLSEKDWQILFALSEIHHVQPMIVSAVYKSTAGELAKDLIAPIKRRAIHVAMLQAAKTSEFLKFYSEMPEPKPLVVKGLLCRNLYVQPDCRMSSDEDLWQPGEAFFQTHAFLVEHGFCPTGADIRHRDDAAYCQKNGPLYLELHRKLLDDTLFRSVNQRLLTVAPMEVWVDGRGVWTLPHTEHLLFLICHAMKHFLHSGFGIRQVSDITLFANAHGREIHWERLLADCKQVNADKFAAAVFQIGERYLTFSPENACYPPAWSAIDVDCTDMLEDLLDSGVFGSASLSRQHSSTITLNAAKGRKKVSIVHSIFPSVKKMKAKFPYLQKHPYLLPVAWGQRMLRYRRELRDQSDSDAAESIRLGNQRVELLREYGILRKL